MQGQHIPQLAMHWATDTSPIMTLYIIIIFHLLMGELKGFSRYHVLFRADQWDQRARGFPSWSGWALPSYRRSQMNRTLSIKSWVCRKRRACEERTTERPMTHAAVVPAKLAGSHFLQILSINPFSAGIDFRRQNLTSVDVRLWRLKSIIWPLGSWKYFSA